jgi:hypothetical protein
MYSNRIKFNCSQYLPISTFRPPNCYNCAYRDGFPDNLGGDKNCATFKPKERKIAARKPEAVEVGR